MRATPKHAAGTPAALGERSDEQATVDSSSSSEGCEWRPDHFQHLAIELAVGTVLSKQSGMPFVSTRVMCVRGLICMCKVLSCEMTFGHRPASFFEEFSLSTVSLPYVPCILSIYYLFVYMLQRLCIYFQSHSASARHPFSLSSTDWGFDTVLFKLSGIAFVIHLGHVSGLTCMYNVPSCEVTTGHAQISM